MKKALAFVSVMFSVGLIFNGCSKQAETRSEQTVVEEPEKVPETTVVQPDTIKKSIPAEANGTVGSANIKINYHAPAVRNRVIWGGLVPYEQVWVTGAHKATAIEFDKNLIVEGQSVPAGKYALFTIPGQEEWTVILNKDWEQHLADDYDSKKDVVRVKVKPVTLEQHQERLKYDVKSDSGSEGAITIRWEKLLIPVSVKVGS